MQTDDQVQVMLEKIRPALKLSLLVMLAECDSQGKSMGDTADVLAGHMCSAVGEALAEIMGQCRTLQAEVERLKAVEGAGDVLERLAADIAEIKSALAGGAVARI